MPDAPDMFSYERELSAQFACIAGGDEAGRGCLAGPVTAALVVFKIDHADAEIRDSKLLTGTKREELFDLIIRDAVTYAVATASPLEVDKINILEATRLAFTRAFEKLNPPADFLLLDALKIPLLGVPQLPLIKGEWKSRSIAAASILAKVSRDRYMTELDKEYPGYGFAIHKGYGTAVHLKALEKLGPCPVHRMTFRKVKKEPADMSGPDLFGD